MKILLFEFFPVDLDESSGFSTFGLQASERASHHFTGDEQVVGLPSGRMNRGETSFAEDVGHFVVLQTDESNFHCSCPRSLTAETGVFFSLSE